MTTHLNANKCYKLIKVEKSALPSEIVFSQHWLTALGNLVSDTLSLEKPARTKLLYNLTTKIGPRSNYKSRLPLAEALQNIYQRLAASGPTALTDGHKYLIAQKLYEGASACPEGIHNRAYEILLGFNPSPHNLDELLSQIRHSIVHRVARQSTSEVHAVNRFFTLANVCGYGVYPINKHDCYIGAISDSLIKEQLEIAFDHRYTIPGILSGLIDGIKDVLHTEHDYKGRQETGYTQRSYEGFQLFLKKIMPNKAILYDDYFVLEGLAEDSPRIVDLNWIKIKQELFDTLVHENYFALSDRVRVSLQALLSHEHISPSFDFKRLFVAGPIKNTLSLCHLLSCTEYVQSTETQLALIKTYLREASLSPEVFILVLAEIIESSAKNKGLIQAIKDTYRKELKEHARELLTLGTKSLREILENNLFWELSLNCFSLLDESEKQAIVSHQTPGGWNVIMMAACLSPSLIPPLLTLIPSPNTLKRSLVSHRTPEGMNAIQLATIFHTSSPLTLLEAITPFDDDTRFLLLSQLDIYDQHVMLLAINHNPSAIPALITMINTFDEDKKFAIWSQINKEGMNAIHLAAISNHAAFPAVLEALASFGNDRKFELLSKLDAHGQNAILLAIYKDASIVPHLVRALASLNDEQKFALLSQVNIAGTHALLIAARSNHQALCKLLEMFNHDKKLTFLSSIKIKKGKTLLMLAAEAGVEDAVRLLLELKIDGIDATDESGYTALDYAALNGHRYVLRILLKNKATIHGQESTSLHKAIYNGHYEIVHILLNEQADSCLSDEQGNNAFDVASNRHPELMKPLLLNAIKGSFEKQKCIQTKADTKKNILMLLLEFQPKLINTFLKRLKASPENEADLIKLFTATDAAGKTVWDYATKVSLETARRLFNFAKNLGDPIHQSIHRTYNNTIVLLHKNSASKRRPLFAVLELTFISLLEQRKKQEQRLPVVQDPTKKQMNTRLVEHFCKLSTLNFRSIKILCKAIADLDLGESDNLSIQTGLLKQLNEYNENLLMHALSQKTRGALPILKLMSSLNITSEIEIFLQVDLNCQNAIMLSLRHNQKALPALLEKIKAFPPNVQLELFLHRDHLGDTIFDHAAQFPYHRSPTILLLKHLETLTLSINISPILKPMTFDRLIDAEQILMTLKLRHQVKKKYPETQYSALTQSEMVALKDTLSASHWYEIITKEYIPSEEIRRTTEKKYLYIAEDIEKDDQSIPIENSKNSKTPLGQFVWIRNSSFFSRRSNSSTLRSTLSSCKDKARAENNTENSRIYDIYGL